MNQKVLKLRVDAILEYYDFPQLLTARDCFDTLYLCLLYSDEPECRYMGIKISSARLLQFYNGNLDLRTLFLQPEGGKQYYEICYRNDAYLINLEPSPSISEDRLPAEGYYMDKVSKESYMVNIPIKDHGIFKEIVRTLGWVCL